MTGRGLLVGLMLPIALLSACASTPSTDATGGISLTLWRNDSNAASYYTVDRDGTIGFGGGQDARLYRTSWTGALTPEEITQLQQIVDEHDGFRSSPGTEGETNDLQYRLEIRSAAGTFRQSWRGESPEVTPLEALLDAAARRRLEGFLDTLPRAGPRP